MSSNNSIAIITGGASGIGLGVGEALIARGGWTIYLLDRDEVKGQAAAKRISAEFHEIDVTNYSSLASAFALIFQKHGQLNFVFANAGIAVDPTQQLITNSSEREVTPPPPPSMLMMEINLHSVMFTTHLAQHYFRQTPVDSKPRSIVITASSVSFYASPISPAYCASKHGALGWMRSIAPGAQREDHISVNAICPGIVRTSILPDEMFAMFPEQLLTPVSKVVERVLMLLGDASLNGQALEICGTNHYFRKQIEYCDATMAAVMGATDVS